MHARAQAHGADVAIPVGDTPFGSHQFVVRDPEGNVWVVGTYVPSARVGEPDIVEVAIRDDMIRLGQFLKLANLAGLGADAKPVVQAGAVRVNGEVETRRGRQLHRGDVRRPRRASRSAST